MNTSTLNEKMNAAEIEALLAAGKALCSAQTPPDKRSPAYSILPKGWVIVQHEASKAPDLATGTIKVRDAASFVRVFTDHAVPASRIYATLEPARFLAVFDDFEQAQDRPITAQQAAWRQFRAEFSVPASREWSTWNAQNRKPMGQLQFAEFLQDNLPDIDGDGAALLELALRFEANTNSTFIAHQRLKDGTHNLVWRVEGASSGNEQASLPEVITLKLPVFENTEPVSQTARLRYRAKEGVLTIWYELVRPHKTLEAAFRQTWTQIEAGTKQKIVLGSPE